MDDDDDTSLENTITSTEASLTRLYRELQARNVEESTTLSSSSLATVRQSLESDTEEISPTGDSGPGVKTLSQAMHTMLGDRQIQTINLAENNDENGVSVYCPEVEVFVAPASSSVSQISSGSNKVKITTVVNHVWDLKYYHGNLVAVHRDAVYVAYVLGGRYGGNVRVISRKNAHRVLLKSFQGSVVDIAFALSDDICLAAADESGNVFVYYFNMGEDGILSNLALHIKLDTSDLESDRTLTRVIWCPYMPADDDNEEGLDPSKMLVLLHGTEAEVWNIESCRDVEGSTVSSSSVNVGVMRIESYEPMVSVVNAAFAPDGSAVAVAYMSGIVKFFLVDLDGERFERGCMHDWNPHDGNPVTSLYFLDDHKHPGIDLQLWKFALTGALYNTEIKLWSCETWACMQTITLRPPLNQPDLKLELKSEIDLSSRYLALSDVNSRVLYVLQIYQKHDSSTVHVSSLSQFSLTQPCLSFSIFEAGERRFRHSANDSHLDEITTGELHENHDDGDQEGRNGAYSEEEVTTGVQIRMYGVHTKSLQELLIRYRPESSIPHHHASSVSSISQETGLRNILSDVSMDQTEASQDLSVVTADTPHKLITPKDFESSSPNISHSNGVRADSVLSSSNSSSFTHVTALKEDLLSLHSPHSSVKEDLLNMHSPHSSVKEDLLSLHSPYSSVKEDLLSMHSPHSSVDPSSVLSPSSTFTQTPQSRPSPGGNVSLSNVPLPPITSSEEAELATPKSSAGAGGQSGSSSSKSNQEVLEELFRNSHAFPKMATPLQGHGNTLESTSSTGSFPVGSLRGTYRDQEDKYDDNDKEVAEALGLQKEEAKEDIDEEPESEQQEGRQELAWPEPPNVFTQAKRLESTTNEPSVREDEEEKDSSDDENDEAEVEEIIPCQEADDEDEDVEDEAQAQEYTKRSKGADMDQTSVHVLTSIDTSIARLAEQLRTQQEMMQQMQAELNRQREIQLQLHRHQLEQQELQNMAAQQPSLEKDISKLEDILISRMEHSLAQHMQRETQRLQESLKASDNQRKQRDDVLHTNILNEVARNVKETVSNSIRTEVKQTVTPALHKFVEPMKEKIHQEVAHRLTACDTLLKENISKAVKSRSTMDLLATSVGDVIYQQLQQAYTDTFKTSMLPSFKSVMEKTVKDVHGIFQQGTKEYQLYMRQNMDQMLRERVAAETIVGRMEAAEKNFIHSIGQLKSLVVSSVKEELSSQMTHAVSGVKEEIVKDVRKVMKEELNVAMKEHGASISDKLTTYLRSGAATPVPQASSEEENIKERISRDLRLGRINDAFQSALSAGNLDLVVHTCEAATSLDIFSKHPCPLTQPVLLSLISQLSSSLDKHFDLKMKYLEEALIHLDPLQPMTADHIPNVLGGLVQRLRVAESHSADPRKSRTIKMLVMAARSLMT